MSTILQILLILQIFTIISIECLLSNPLCGQPSDIKHWLTIVYRKNEDPEIKEAFIDNNCFATIISEQWLLSAASCLTGSKDPKYFQIKLHDKELGQPSIIDKIVVNPKYNPTRGAGYDLALLKLRFALPFDSDPTIRPICLADYDPNEKSTFEITVDCKLSHRIYVKDKEPEEIDEKISQLNSINCQDMFGSVFDDNLMFCADKAVCALNNGAPLVCQDLHKPDGEQYYLAALASWGQTECKSRDCDAYTKLFANDYASWINSTINSNN